MKQISEFGPGELAAAVAATHKWYKSDDGYFWYERNEDDIEIFTGCTVSNDINCPPMVLL